MSTRLHRAILSGKAHIVEELLRQGEDPNEFNRLLGRPLHYAAGMRDVPIVKLLIDYGANINMKHHIWKTTALHVASKAGHIALMKLLLQHGAKVNTHSWYGRSYPKWGYTPLHSASEFGHIEAVKLLLTHGAKPNHRGKYGLSAKEVAKSYKIKTMFKCYETMKKNNEWRPWNHAEYPIRYRLAMRELVILAKSRVNYNE